MIDYFCQHMLHVIFVFCYDCCFVSVLLIFVCLFYVTVCENDSLVAMSTALLFALISRI